MHVLKSSEALTLSLHTNGIYFQIEKCLLLVQVFDNLITTIERLLDGRWYGKL